MSTPTRRRYDRPYDWAYDPRLITPRPEGAGLIPISWDGLSLNTGDQPSGLCSVVERVEGWLDSPPLDGNDAGRSIADGAAWGPKTLGPRTVVIEGAAAGPRGELSWLRDQLAARAAARVPAVLAITDPGLDRTLTADVRAGTEALRVSPLGSAGYRWQVTLTAADPLLYEAGWQTVRLSNIAEDEDTGRPYPRDYQWQYASPYLPNTARLSNAGNVGAPVFALYEGALSESRLTGDTGAGGPIRLDALGAQLQIRVDTATLAAEAEGGLSRAAYILPGSRPMTLPAGATSRWHLFSVGLGSVTLAWRSAWA